MGDKNCQVTCIHTLVLIQPGGVRLIKDVRDGRGVKGKADKCGKGGGRGSKIPEILRTSFLYGPFVVNGLCAFLTCAKVCP